MKYRWKLLIMLLIVAVIPPLALRTFGAEHLHRLGDELIRQTLKDREAHLKGRLQYVLDTYYAGMRVELNLATTILRMQALEVDQLLSHSAFSGAGRISEPVAIRKDSRNDSVSEPAIRILPGLNVEDVAMDVARLSAMASVYPNLSSRLIMRHQTVLLTGLIGIYPGSTPIPPSWNPTTEEWFEKAVNGNGDIWSGAGTDPLTGREIITAALAVKRPDGGIGGVTAVVIPVADLFGNRSLIQYLPPHTQSFIVKLEKNRQGGGPGLVITADLAASENKKSNTRRIDTPKSGLVSGDEREYRAMEAELRTYSGNLRRMPFEGRDSLWAYKTIFFPYALVLITPVETVLSTDVGSIKTVNQLIDNQFDFSLYLMLAMILVAVVLAILFSRTFTRPLRTLTQGVQHLTAGHFHTRVDIRSRDEIGELGRVFNTLGPLLEERVRVAHSMVLATEMQSNLLPQSDPEVPGLDVSGSCIYCDRVGGDYYDYLIVGERRQGKFGVVVGDVAGHGISAALVMATARALLHQRASFPGCIDCDLSDINRHLYQDIGESGRFMTLFYCEFDTRGKSVHWVRAGHDPAIVYNPHTDVFDELYGQGVALGVFEDVDYIENQHGLRPGQIYAFGTDGLWETRNIKGELFGKERLREIVRSQADKSAKDMKKAVLEAVQNYRGSQKQEDDITLVIVKVG